MNDANKDLSGALPWYSKLAAVLLFPFVLPATLLVVPIILLMCIVAIISNYFLEQRVYFRMRRCGRYLSLGEIRSRIAEQGGTLIIESPSLGWGYTHAWWTPDDLLVESPFAVPTEDDYRNAAENMRCLDWDYWCWKNYTCLDNGRGYLLRVRNGASLERTLKRWFPDLKIARTWTALAHYPEAPEPPGSNVA